jgi:glucokinase
VDGRTLLLAGDVGGTKTALGVFSAERGPAEPLVGDQFASADYPSLVPMVEEFLARAGLTVRRACFAVAGPVLGGRATITNLSWLLDERELTAQLGVGPVSLFNDVEASALAVTSLQPNDLHTLNSGEPEPRGSVAVIAPGTGLGQAYLTWDGSRYRAFPSEGGHADFAPATELEAGLLTHLMRRYGHVSVERVCSGPGLLNIYEYLREGGEAPESTEVGRQLAAPDADKPAVIGEAAVQLPDPDPLSRAAVELFVSILGAEAGNLALKILSTGGIYVAGGIPLRLLPALEGGHFMRAFTDKGRLRDLMVRIPVRVTMHRTALRGAAMRGLEKLGSDPN